MADNSKKEYNKILLTIDVTYDVIKFAQEIKADLIISHHPLDIEFVTESSNKIHNLLIEKNIRALASVNYNDFNSEAKINYINIHAGIRYSF